MVRRKGCGDVPPTSRRSISGCFTTFRSTRTSQSSSRPTCSTSSTTASRSRGIPRLLHCPRDARFPAGHPFDFVGDCDGVQVFGENDAGFPTTAVIDPDAQLDCWDVRRSSRRVKPSAMPLRTTRTTLLGSIASRSGSASKQLVVRSSGAVRAAPLCVLGPERGYKLS